ncbi:Beta-glucosidase protein [Dioscorea alata]|uniref:Beta-glucosidase protein n=1 Tax=Dioscorea alata TaxID=55571 RepID=A0ACB7VJ95_DIOAL|nr:Beta-glucosidase protein [Dioscorea alata]
MSPLALILLLLATHLILAASSRAAGGTLARDIGKPLRRSGFPPGFVFGTASSAYQYEGGAREGGRGPSMWDAFTHDHPEKIADGSNGDVALDFYHRYKEDVNLMKEMGVDAFRLSISWSRILPNGNLSGGINKEGIQFYNNLINELISKGLKPFVTIFHWDVPQGLQDQYGGFLSPLVVEDFKQFSNICFQEFGDRVKHWITLNEAYIFSIGGYASGFLAPGRCTPGQGSNCFSGDSGKEPYIVAHNLLLSHAAAANLYKTKYQVYQKGKIGITHAVTGGVPLSNSKSDIDATKRYLDFSYGWFMDPLTYGDYPFIMKSIVGERLPKFTEEQSKSIKGSFDFIGINYYTSNYVSNVPFSQNQMNSYLTDSFTNLTVEKKGIPIGPVAGSSWLHIYPKGIQDVLEYTKTEYNDPVIYITENGVDEVNNETMPLQEALKDDTRIHYYQQHLHYVQKAIRNGVNVRGYFAWSLLDDFEWNSGYTIRFGIHYTDYKNGLKRYRKSSAYWFEEFLKN